jgi:hypothetical protein
MALTQIVEIQDGTKTRFLVSKADTIAAEWHRLRLSHHRETGGLGRYSIGHYNGHGDFVGPSGSSFKG